MWSNINLFMIAGSTVRRWRTACKIKGELREILIYFRKIPLHQQNFLVVSVLSNLPWCREIWKNVQNKTTKRFSVGNTNINISTNQGNFVYKVLRKLEPAVKAKILTFVLPTEKRKRLVVSFWTFFQISR